MSKRGSNAGRVRLSDKSWPSCRSGDLVWNGFGLRNRNSTMNYLYRQSAAGSKSYFLFISSILKKNESGTISFFGLLDLSYLSSRQDILVRCELPFMMKLVDRHSYIVLEQRVRQSASDLPILYLKTFFVMLHHWWLHAALLKSCTCRAMILPSFSYCNFFARRFSVQKSYRIWFQIME